jgi:hypothetical protein
MLYERVEKISDVDASRSTRSRLLGRAAKACLGKIGGVALP